MPGETQETVDETIEFVKYYVEQSPKTDPNSLSVNFAQALPGTPLYEVGRAKGAIGQTLKDEEDYLLAISDRDARDCETTINFTDYPKIFLEKWRFDICNSTRNAYINKWGLDNYHQIVLNSQRYKGVKENSGNKKSSDSGYFAEPARAKENTLGLNKNPKIELASSVVADTVHDIKEKIEITDNKIPSLFFLLRKKSISSAANFYPRLFWSTRKFSFIYIFFNECRKNGLTYSVKLAITAIIWKIAQIKATTDQPDEQRPLSLRKALKKGNLPSIIKDNPAMGKLRLGR
jgi:hypothetical protein